MVNCKEDSNENLNLGEAICRSCGGEMFMDTEWDRYDRNTNYLVKSRCSLCGDLIHLDKEKETEIIIEDGYYKII